MRGAVLYGPRDVRFEEREVPKTAGTSQSFSSNSAILEVKTNSKSPQVDLCN
jgi:hypothetical protein